MINSPYKFEDAVTAEQYQKLGYLSLKWSTLAYVVGDTLAAKLRLTEDEATAVVFPMSLEGRMNLLKRLFAITPPSKEAATLFAELQCCVRALQVVRNNVAHALLTKNEKEVSVWLRSKQRTFTLEQVFSTEELTNYAGHVFKHLRAALKLQKARSPATTPLPGRPQIPKFLQSYFPKPKDQKKAKRRSPPQSSRA
jgi:hypothetical protein